MIRVGAVNIDTSHPMGFADAMAETGKMRYVAIYNDSFRDDAEVQGFMKRYDLEKRCDSIEELADMCDVVFIQGCDWDEHLKQAEIVVKKGKPVFIDKPLVGNFKDLETLRSWGREGAVILGSSSARYAYELQALLGQPVEERGEVLWASGSCGVDEFNYGVHIVAALHRVLGRGVQSVRWLGRGDHDELYEESFEMVDEKGQRGIYTMLTGVWQPFVLNVLTTKQNYALKLDPNRLYSALMREIEAFMEQKPNRLAEPEELFETIEVLLAGSASRKQGGSVVRLEEIKQLAKEAPDEAPYFDGPLFKKGYAAAAGKLYALD